MARKIPTLDVNALIVHRTQEIMANLTERLQNIADNFKQNYQVLLALAQAGLIKPEKVNEFNVKYGTAIKFPQSKLARVRAALGRITEKTDGDNRDVRLEDAKKRLILIGLKMEEFPNSDIQLFYIRKYTKEDEQKFPCKIQKVEVSPAQPAQPAMFEYRLVCPT